MKLKQLFENYEWKLYLDDIRNPKEKDFIIARSVKEAIELIKKNGFPSFMSLDHDLGVDKKGNLLDNGYDFIKWIVKEYENKDLPDFEYIVHSANPVGKENITGLLNNFIRHKNS